MHYVYILYSPSQDKYYVGQTPDLDTRLLFHNELSERSWTSRYRPWELVRSIEVPDRGTAVRLERYIKRQKSKIYVADLVHDAGALVLLLAQFGLEDSAG